MTENKKNFIAVSIIALGIAFLILGIYRNEVFTVWKKAINICLECIGIG